MAIDDPLPKIVVSHPHVEARPEILAGSPIVRGTRVPIRRIWAWHRKGVTVEILVKRYPTLGPAKILDALSFAYDHQELMAADIAREIEMMELDEMDHPSLSSRQLRLPQVK